MTEIKRDKNGNVLCPICGGILMASFNSENTVYQNGESDDYKIIENGKQVICTQCHTGRGSNWISRPDFLRNEKDFEAHFYAIIENWQKHSLS